MNAKLYTVRAGLNRDNPLTEVWVPATASVPAFYFGLLCGMHDMVAVSAYECATPRCNCDDPMQDVKISNTLYQAALLVILARKYSIAAQYALATEWARLEEAAPRLPGL